MEEEYEQEFGVSGVGPGGLSAVSSPKPRGRPYEKAYEEWLSTRSGESMSRLLDAFAPTINSEITRYEGPRHLLRSRARVLAVKAIKSYNPASGAKLQSWVVTNLQPLARYGQHQRDVHAPEMAIRQAAEVNRVSRELSDELGRDPTDDELADEIGISPQRVRYVRSRAKASVASGTLDEAASFSDEGGTMAPGVSGTDPVPFATEAVYMSLSPRDRMLFDGLTGGHGRKAMSGKDLAASMGMSQSAVSTRASEISRMIAEVANAWG